MTYLDTSVLLAELLGEDRFPPAGLWDEPLFSSRLLVYETWVRLNAKGLAATHAEAADQLLSRVNLVELSPLVLERALSPFPVPVRTLDALHLATLEWLASSGRRPVVAAYDVRLREAAVAMGYALHQLAG